MTGHGHRLVSALFSFANSAAPIRLNPAFAMKTKLKVAKLSSPRTVAAPSHAVVPLKERRLNFGNRWDYAPAPEDSKNYVIAPQHELFIGGKFVKPTSGKYFES